MSLRSTNEHPQTSDSQSYRELVEELMFADDLFKQIGELSKLSKREK